MLTEFFSTKDPDLTRRFEWTGEWSTWEQALVVLAALAVLSLTVYNYRRLRPLRRRIGLLSLRVAALALLLFVFFQPAYIDERIQKSRHTVVVLVDDSESLTLPYDDGSRLEALGEWLSEHTTVFRDLSQDHDVEVLRFADFVEPTELEGIGEALTGKGPGTQLVEALEDIAERFRTRRLGGVVIVSDGVDNGKLATRLEDSVGLDNETRRFVEGLGVPIYAVGFQDAAGVRDISVQSLRFTPFAFHLNATSMDATIRAVGYEAGTRVPVSLYEDGKLVNSQMATIVDGVRDYPLTFDFVPRDLGDRVYTVAATPLPGELYDANNEKWAVVKVIRDRIRVLQICGRTSWDERFLRNLLKRNPSVDLISFFILINPAFAPALSSRDTTLIPFPAQELFVEELGGFDLIVFQDFNYGPFHTAQHLWRVRDFVKQGGAFLMVGGARSFSEGRYHSTEITEILPIEIPPSLGGGETLDTARFSPVLTPAGKSHPISQLSLDPAENARQWGSLPELEGLNKITKLRPDAVSLLDHPTLRTADGKAMPVVAVGEAGEGRVMTVMTDSTWEWAFRHSGNGGTPAEYNAFWNNAIRWLIRDPELELVRVSVSDTQHKLGESVAVEVRVFGHDYQPAPKHPLEVKVVRRGSIRQWQEVEVLTDDPSARTDEAGVYTVNVAADKPGVYEVTASAKIGERTASNRQVFVVVDTNPEFEATVPPLNYLALLADATGGKVFDVDEEPAFAFKPPDVTQVIERSETALWSGVDVLLLAAALLGAEWWYRRKYGYL
jgi:uncharacterized membrane protein